MKDEVSEIVVWVKMGIRGDGRKRGGEGLVEVRIEVGDGMCRIGGRVGRGRGRFGGGMVEIGGFGCVRCKGGWGESGWWVV